MSDPEKDANLHAKIQELQQYLESLQNTLAQVTAEKFVLGDALLPSWIIPEQVDKVVNDTIKATREDK